MWAITGVEDGCLGLENIPATWLLQDVWEYHALAGSFWDLIGVVGNATNHIFRGSATPNASLCILLLHNNLGAALVISFAALDMCFTDLKAVCANFGRHRP